MTKSRTFANIKSHIRDYLNHFGCNSPYDLQTQKTGRTEFAGQFPLRFHDDTSGVWGKGLHGTTKMDSRSLKAEADYVALKKVIIIMIMPFDPFGLNRMMYTIKNCCIEEPGMPYEDGATTIFLYTKGKVEIPSEALQELMTYMVEHVKHEEEVSIKYNFLLTFQL